ncbi:MAG: Na/Pi cotransporter family protein [Flavobacteriales bacterium]
MISRYNKFATSIVWFFVMFLSFSGLASESLNTPPNYDLVEALSKNPDKSVFQNLHASSKEEGAVLSWNIDYDLYQLMEGKSIVVEYNTDIGAKRNKKGIEGSEWMYSDPLPYNATSLALKELKGEEKYVFKVGVFEGDLKQALQKDNGVYWSDKGKFKTKRAWGLVSFLILIGSLSLFIYGMKIMSEGLQRAAGSKLRQMLRSITSNRWKGVLSGFGITAIVQSSSVTTVMTVSFVNAGLLTLRQSAGVMMGANIGTTITAWLVLLLGFKVSISSYALVILAIAGPLLFIKSGKAKAWASALFGFCILFIGLNFLKDAAPSLGIDSPIVQFFETYKLAWYGPLMFVILGALVTVIIQSSSAAMALTLTMVSTGVIPFEVACAMVLGENIGTTITAELASLIANVHAKRSARIHSLFNIVGVTWMLLIFPLALSGITAIVGWSEGAVFDPSNVSDPQVAAMSATGIALFHTCFNLANVLLLIWFVPQIVRIAERTVKSKGDEDEQFRLEFISGSIETPSLSLLEVRKELHKFGGIAHKMSKITQDLLGSTDKKVQTKCYERLEKYEEITDRVEIEISSFLSKMSKSQMSEKMTLEVQGILGVSNDLETIGDIYFQIGKAIEAKNDKKHWFNQEQRDSLQSMNVLVEKAFSIMLDNLDRSNTSSIDLETAKEAEQAINKYRNKLRKKHLKTVGEEGYNMKGGIVYSDVFSSLEKIGDHIINVTETLIGEGDIS